ncbi:MAG TPA: radical SAM protein [Rhizomicrobium sp.]|nr:radical SAM protein [Rhizomicrobium sp.]
MDASEIAEYDIARNLSGKAVRSMCYAPHVDLYFDQWGKVRACCRNRNFPIGDIAKDSIDAIWHGERLRLLRREVEAYSFARGCEDCERQVENGWLNSTNMQTFDQFDVEEPDPEWPRIIELSISNSCNLECVMCNGECSSAIRARREGRPARPKYYPDNFADSLRKYLAHALRIKFLGGEPFLVPEYYRIWEMMIGDGLKTHCHITTNGTQYNARIENIMASLRVSLAVSIDGTTKETVEGIRVNADFDTLMANVRAFAAQAQSKNRTMALTFCFMRQNWHEFGDFCLLADALACRVVVNQVSSPPQFGVYNLPLDELRTVRDAMARQAPILEPRLGANLSVWQRELERMRVKVRQLEKWEEDWPF